MKLPRFSLRALFVAVTAVAVVIVWVRYQQDWIRQRHEFAKRHIYTTGPDRSGRLLPWSLRLFGEWWYVFADPDPKYNAEIARLFPEAKFDHGTYLSTQEMINRRDGRK